MFFLLLSHQYQGTNRYMVGIKQIVIFFCCLLGCCCISNSTIVLSSLLVRPKTIVFGRTSVLLWFFLSFFSSRNLRALSADRREILHDARCCVQFYNPGPKFWGSLPKKIFRGQKHAKFGQISVDFEVWRRIFPEWMKIFKIGELLVRQRFLPR